MFPGRNRGSGSRLSRTLLNYPTASCGVSELGDEICLKGVTPPNVFIGGPVPNPSVVSHVEPALKACGNDGLRIGNLFNAASCGESDRLTVAKFLASKFQDWRTGVSGIPITPAFHHSNIPLAKHSSSGSRQP